VSASSKAATRSGSAGAAREPDENVERGKGSNRFDGCPKPDQEGLGEKRDGREITRLASRGRRLRGRRTLVRRGHARRRRVERSAGIRARCRRSFRCRRFHGYRRGRGGNARALRALDDIDGHLELANDGHLLVVTFVVRGRHARSLWAASPTGELLEVHATVTIRTEGERLAELWKTCTVRHIATAPRAGGMEEARSWAQRWRLTVRETSVAELAMNGHADKEIAARLALAPTSVSKYLRAVLRKAGVASRSALAERAGVVHIG
jgi:DNA-binding CsgD family transcriptional regulator